jgi:hypothetical protein
MRIATLRIHVALRPRHKEAGRLMQPVQALEIDVAAIHDVKGAGFELEIVNTPQSAFSAVPSGGYAGIMVIVQDRRHCLLTYRAGIKRRSERLPTG